MKREVCGPVRYHLMREDDNGRQFFVSCTADPRIADQECTRLGSSGHKQYYWVATVCNCDHF